MIRTLLVLLFSLGVPFCAVAQQPNTLERGLDGLMQLQGEDGGWHSQQYGSLKQGAALTTTVLYSLSHLPKESLERHRGPIGKGMDFLSPGLERSGFIINPDGSEDYPVYCTAMLLVACQKLNLELDPAVKQRMIQYLLDCQVAEKRGFEADHLEYGGWDVLGPDTLDGKTSGTNVSATAFVVEALTIYRDQPDVKDALAKAKQWALRIASQSSDGGFFFTPKLDSMNNKAAWNDTEFRKPRSYGSATCDGIHVLIACGTPASDPIISSAVDWLVEHSETNHVPGFDANEESDWRNSLKFYYLASLAKSLPLLPKDIATKRNAAILDELKASQHGSGLWQNASALMREDDPLIATSFAVMALSLIQQDE